MSGLRWSTSYSLILTSILALCIGGRLEPIVSAKDKATAATADDNEAVPGQVKSKTTSKKKSRPKPEKKTKKQKESEEETGTNTGALPSGNGRTGGSIPLVPGGSGTGSSTGNGKVSSQPLQPSPPGQQTTASSGAKQGSSVGKATTPNTPPTGGGGGGVLDANHPVVKRVIAVQDRLTPSLMSQKGVVATLTGLDDDGNVVIKVYTTGADNPTIPKSAEGVDVLETVTGPGHALAAFNPAARQPRPVPIGVGASGLLNGNCGPSLINLGTIGCRVKDSKGNVYALGSSHTFANENQGTVGDQCSQPTTFDENPLVGSCPADIFGTLSKFSTLTFNGAIPNPPLSVLDAAIVATTKDMVSNSTPPPPVGYGTPRTQVYRNPYLGQSVQKFGRSTGLTTGAVSGLNMTSTVQYFSGFCTFAGQIEVKTQITNNNFSTFTSFGDSGALVVDSNRFPVGLVVGEFTTTVLNPIQQVLDFFDVTIDGDASEVVPPGKSVRSTPNSP